jgi:hypothetical protein
MIRLAQPRAAGPGDLSIPGRLDEDYQGLLEELYSVGFSSWVRFSVARFASNMRTGPRSV